MCGMKSRTNTANVENAGSINNPPGCLSMYVCIYTYLDFLWVSAWRAEEFFFSLFTSPFTFLEGFAGLGLLGYPSIMFCLAWRHLNQECLEEAFPVSSRVGFSLRMPRISYT